MALRAHRQVPSVSTVPSAVRPVHENGYMPGAVGPVNDCRATPSGPMSETLIVDGRTTLYASAWASATPSPFGESTGTAGTGAWIPEYPISSASDTARSPDLSEGRLAVARRMPWPSSRLRRALRP